LKQTPENPVIAMYCRIGCGACCVAPSISSPLPGMPRGKPAGVRCVNLDELNRCRVWGTADYPAVCRGFRASADVCGETAAEAMVNLTVMEKLTAPG
jgi:Fe-S-cluster containining protein